MNDFKKEIDVKRGLAESMASVSGLSFEYHYDVLTASRWFMHDYESTQEERPTGRTLEIDDLTLLQIFFHVNEYRLRHPNRNNSWVWHTLADKLKVNGKIHGWTWWRDRYSQARKWLINADPPYSIVEQLEFTVKKERTRFEQHQPGYMKKMLKRSKEKVRNIMKKELSPEEYEILFPEIITHRGSW